MQVLLVDDMASVRAILKVYLRDFGFTFAEAPNGAEGLVQARQSKPDLIVVDLMMPVMDGTRFLSEVRKDPDLTSVPVIVLSANSDQFKLDPSKGRTYVALKPIEPEALKKVVKEALQIA